MQHLQRVTAAGFVAAAFFSGLASADAGQQPAGAVSPFFAAAQQADTPERLAARYFQALQQRGMVGTVDFIHPDELVRFKDLLMPVFQAEAAAKKSGLRDVLFGAGATLQTVEAAAPDEFMRKVLSIGAMAQQLGQITFERMEVLGSVTERKDLVHVVVRAWIGALGVSDISSMDVVTVRPHDGQWRLMLNSKMEGFARGLQMALKGKG